MDIKPIKTETDYETALQRIETLWGCKPDTTAGDEFDILVTLVEAYEAKHHRIGPPDPIEAIKFRMDQSGLKQTDLVPYFGGKSRVSEVLSGRKNLTLTIARRLHLELNIPAASLLA